MSEKKPRPIVVQRKINNFRPLVLSNAKKHNEEKQNETRESIRVVFDVFCEFNFWDRFRPQIT